jgi:hypothetical protein
MALLMRRLLGKRRMAKHQPELLPGRACVTQSGCSGEC